MKLEEFIPYLTPSEIFAAVIPGAVGTYILWVLLGDGQLVALLPLPAGAEWVAYLIISLILGYAVQPPSHLLNLIYDQTYRAYRRREGDPLLQFARNQAENEGLLVETFSVYEWAKTKVQATEPSLMNQIDKIQGISKMFRSLCFFAMIGTLAAWWMYQWLFGAVLLLVGLLCFLVFSERRWAASTLIYQRFKEIAGDKLKATGKDRSHLSE